MTDKAQKIRQEVEKLKSNLIHGACASQIAMETRCKEEAYNEVLAILDSVQEEPVSEDLEEASKEWLKPQLDKSCADYGEVKMMELTHFDGYAMLDAIEFGAKWQKEQDQSTIELAEDHAMLAGMEKMKEQMMAKGVDGVVHHFEKCEVASIHYNDPTGVPMSYFMSSKGFLTGDKVKIVVIKKD